MMKRHARQRGVALITVILVLLVLTVIALAASTMMTQEDRTAARMELQKAAFYAAEAGLRRGEEVLLSLRLADMTDLLQYQSTTDPIGIRSEHIRHPEGAYANTWDVTHLGTILRAQGTGGIELADQVVPITGVGLDPGRVARYTLFVRNNPEDSRPPGDPQVNADSRIRLISVGVITTGNDRPLSVKILEQEIDYGRIQQSPHAQKLGDAGGTSSVQI